MAMLKCLACGHDNKAGDESCASCATSLNVKVCPDCEAINANRAERCHACGSELRNPQVIERDRPRISLPAKSLASGTSTATAVRRSRAVLVLPLVFVAGAAAYHFFVSSAPSSRGPVQTVTGSVAIATLMPVTVATPSADNADGGVTHEFASGKLVSAPTKPATVSTLMASADIPGGVTHTRRSPAAPPVVASVLATEASKKISAAPVLVVPAAESYSRVTHTKRAHVPSTDVPEPAAASSVIKDQPADCAPSVAALGLCK